MRRGVQPIDRQAGAHGGHALHRSECGDPRARGGVHQPRAVGDRTKYFAEPFELDTIVGCLRIVRGREVREDPVDLDVRQGPDRSIAGRGLVRRSAEPRQAGVHLEMHPRVSPQSGGRLADRARSLDVPRDEQQVQSDRVPDLGRVRRPEKDEDRPVDARVA